MPRQAKAARLRGCEQGYAASMAAGMYLRAVALRASLYCNVGEFHKHPFCVRTLDGLIKFQALILLNI